MYMYELIFIEVNNSKQIIGQLSLQIQRVNGRYYDELKINYST